MTKHVLLNNIEHKNLRVSPKYGAQYGGSVGTVLTFPTEYAEVLREYPIFFRKDSKSGEYVSVALLGFSKDENLYLDGDKWDAGYIPGAVVRGPFFIGFQERQEGAELRREPVIHVDIDDPRVGESEGERLFLEQGGNSRYLQNIATILMGINDGIAMSKAMFASFTTYELIEPVKVEIKLTPDQQFDLVGLYTINEKKLLALSSEAVYSLHRSGFLQGAYLVLASRNNLRRLIERKQRREQRQAAATAS